MPMIKINQYTKVAKLDWGFSSKTRTLKSAAGGQQYYGWQLWSYLLLAQAKLDSAAGGLQPTHESTETSSRWLMALW